ncbi:MAG: preprotein translocase subunit SecG [Limisphaerales bacterium]
MSFVIGVLTFFLVVNCALLIGLVLMQLPKKDAGAGLAFGGGAADALFGAGSGNALTKITKYATEIFFLLALLLGHLQSKLSGTNTSSFLQKVQQQSQMPSTPSASPPSQPAITPTNNFLTLPLTAGTNRSASPKQSK